MLLLKKNNGKKRWTKNNATSHSSRCESFEQILSHFHQNHVFFFIIFFQIHWSKTIENSYPLVIHGSIFSAKFSIEMLTIYTTLLFGNSRPYNLKTAILYRIFDDSKKVSNQISIGKA